MSSNRGSALSSRAAASRQRPTSRSRSARQLYPLVRVRALSRLRRRRGPLLRHRAPREVFRSFSSTTTMTRRCRSSRRDHRPPRQGLKCDSIRKDRRSSEHRRRQDPERASRKSSICLETLTTTLALGHLLERRLPICLVDLCRRRLDRFLLKADFLHRGRG